MRRFACIFAAVLLILSAGVQSFRCVRAESVTLTVPDDFSTIQEAIDNAAHGDTIYVKTGTYYEQVVINKTVSLSGEDVSATIIDADGTGNCLTIIGDGVNVTGLTLQNSGRTLGDAGIYLDEAGACNISGNHITDNFAGVWLEGSSGNFIMTNDIVANVDDGIVFNHAHNNTISGNYVALHEYFGLVLNWSHNNTLSGNNVTQTLGSSHGDGINLWRSEHNHIHQNHVVTNTRFGIRLEVQSNYNILSGNLIGNCSTGLQVYDSSNYNCIYENSVAQCSDGVDINQYSTQNILSNNTITDNAITGIQIYRAQNNQIESNHLANNWGGIGVHGQSHHNYIRGNNMENCTNGVIFHDSDYNEICRNNITECEIAIHFEWLTNFNTIEENDIVTNDCGVQLEQTSDNSFYHNNMMANTLHVSIVGYAFDTWDDGYPSGGNYWSDYIGLDQFSGPYQNVTGGDGIGDTPYIIDANNRDGYPLGDPWSSNSWDWAVDDDGPADFDTIQNAINNAAHGDTIYVKTGTYYEHVVVNKTVSLVGEDVSTTIIDGNGTGHVVNVVSDEVSITGFTVRNSGIIQWPELDAGICLNGTTDCTISDNRLVNNSFFGISLLHSNQNTIIHNNLSSVGWGGVHLMNSSRNVVSLNTITDKHCGVNGHVSSNYNNITGNIISDCTYGGFYHASSHNNICGNNISNIAVEGIWLQDQVNYNLVAENTLINNTVAIRVQGPNYNNTLSRNLITGAEWGIKIENSARYTRVVDNVIVDNHAGNDSWSAGIRLDSGPDSQIDCNTITGNNYGVLLYSSSPRVSILNNTIASNEFGVRVASGGSGYLNVSDNVVMDNRGYGIGLTGFGSSSNNATITRNLIMNNSDGIALGQCSNYNTISQNNISMNDCGLYVEYSTKNMIYSNNVVDNILQVNVTSPSANAWDDGYPSGGNYWSDYGGADAYKGFYQNETGSDGICDAPVVFGGDNTDRYPLMTPWTESSGPVGDVNGDGKVDMKDVGYVARRFMCVPGDPLWDAAADFNSDVKINMVDIGTVARHFGESRP